MPVHDILNFGINASASSKDSDGAVSPKVSMLTYTKDIDDDSHQNVDLQPRWIHCMVFKGGFWAIRKVTKSRVLTYTDGQKKRCMQKLRYITQK